MQKQNEKNSCNPGKWSGKSYNLFGDYLIGKYGSRVLKLPIDAGLSCPNRDGTLSSSGCIFCSDDGSASPVISGCSSIHEQMDSARRAFRRQDDSTKFIAYFQAYTNTYGSADYLKKLYDEAVSFPGIKGLMIGTRPDCIDKEIVEMISGYKRDGFELWIEIGLQTIHDRSLSYLNRGHSHESTEKAVKLIDQYNIDVCVHVILGIPGETWQDMMETAERISALPVQGVKIHHLHIIKGTELEDIYNDEPFSIMDMNQYVSTVCDFLERIRPDMIIHRLMGDRMEDSLVQPRWGLHKGTVIQAIDDEFEKRYTYQGFLYEPSRSF